MASTNTKQCYATTSPYEESIGYYRAVRRLNHILVSGSTAVDPQSPVSSPQILFPGNAKQQTRVAIEECIQNGFVNKDMLVEIEVDAIADDI